MGLYKRFADVMNTSSSQIIRDVGKASLEGFFCNTSTIL